jgi:peptide methionine sulfoxide reductase MsrA
LPGVKKVETGFSGFKEINRIYYDPDLITIKKMTMALKKAGTYLGIKK